ncbi:MAG: hypothetical protein IPL35_01600 [Sphingobacteriales bacterium]|nr:hypothetical protein [Sphingobacteriales bacterium]
MKYIIILFLLTIFSFTKVTASISPVIFKAKIVLKNKTSFTAYFLTWDTETYDSKGKSMLEFGYKVTDKEFQLFLNKQNNRYCYDRNSEKAIKGIRLYKNIYGIQKLATIEIPLFGFCNKNDIVDINANDILYTVFLGLNSSNFPQFENYGIPIEDLDSTSTQDLKKHTIIANFVLKDPKDLSYSFHFIKQQIKRWIQKN